LKKVLAASICLNLLLLMWGWIYLRQTRTPRLQPATPGISAAPANARPNTGLPSFHWRQVESEDYRRYIANLRAIGCPEATVRDIIIMDVNKLYSTRLAELIGSRKRDFWQTSDAFSAKTKQRNEQMARALEKEKRELIHTLLGVDADESSPALTDLMGNNGLNFLSAQKRDPVKAAQEKFLELQSAVFREADEENRAPDWKRLKGLFTEHQAELAFLLSPSELAEYQLRFHPAAENLRARLVGFHASEQEFREVFRLTQGFEEKFAYENLEDARTQSARSAELTDLQAQIRSALGEQRYAEYQRAQNGQFQNLYWLAQRYDLPEESAIKIFEGNRAIQREWEKTELDPGYTPEQRQTLLRRYQEQVQTLVQQTLGERAYRYYQRWGNERWIGN
jgi:hypothetical protein